MTETYLGFDIMDALKLLMAMIILALVGTLFVVLQQCHARCPSSSNKPLEFTVLTDAMRQELMQLQLQQQQPPADASPVEIRDRRVLSDPLYPPLQRTHAPVAQRFQHMVEARSVGVPTRPRDDTYRLVGYVVNSRNKEDVWKLFARAREARRGEGDFYVTPSNRNQDIKVALDPTTDVVTPRLRDLYTLPSEVTFKHPMFEPDVPYTIVELNLPGEASASYW